MRTRPCLVDLRVKNADSHENQCLALLFLASYKGQLAQKWSICMLKMRTRSGVVDLGVKKADSHENQCLALLFLASKKKATRTKIADVCIKNADSVMFGRFES